MNQAVDKFQPGIRGALWVEIVWESWPIIKDGDCRQLARGGDHDSDFATAMLDGVAEKFVYRQGERRAFASGKLDVLDFSAKMAVGSGLLMHRNELLQHFLNGNELRRVFARFLGKNVMDGCERTDMGADAFELVDGRHISLVQELYIDHRRDQLEVVLDAVMSLDHIAMKARVQLLDLSLRLFEVVNIGTGSKPFHHDAIRIENGQRPLHVPAVTLILRAQQSIFGLERGLVFRRLLPGLEI